MSETLSTPARNEVTTSEPDTTSVDTSEGRPTLPDTGDKPETEPTPTPVESLKDSELTSPSKDGEIGAEKELTADEILKSRGHKSIIANKLGDRDRENVIAEAIELKESRERANKGFFMREVVNRIPIVGTLVKANAMRKYKKTIDSADNLSAGLKELGIEYKDLKTINNTSGQAVERANYLIENGVYNEDGTRAHSILDENEYVEKIKISEENQNKINNAFYNYYEGLKEEKGIISEETKKGLENAFNESIKEALKDTEDPDSLRNAMDERLKELEILSASAKHSRENIKDYINQNGSLYRASIKEGLYTKKEVDSLTNAVISGSVFGIVAAAFGSREVRRASRGAATALGASNVVAGGIAGAVAGAIRGADKARVNLSAHEIEQATTFDEQSSAEPESASGEKVAAEGEPTEAETESSAKGSGEKAEKSDRQKKKESILNAVKRFSKGEDILEQIEGKRDRKEATEYISKLDNLMNEVNPDDPKTLEALREAYAEAVAHGRFSSEHDIDLIKYKDPKDRNELEKKLAEAEVKLFGDNPEDIKAGLDPANITETAIQKNIKALSKDYEEAKNLEAKFKARTIAVNAVMGAVAGAGVGAVFGAIREHAPEAGVLGFLHTKEVVDGDNNISLAEDADGGYTVKLGGEEIIGKGEEAGINFNSDGSLTAESEELLKNAGIEVKAHESDPIEIAHSKINVREFFNSENREANGLTEITGRNWVTDNLGNEQAMVGNTHMDGDGNIIMQVVPTQNSNLNLDDMKMVFTAGDGNIDNAIVVDVNPDGTVEIPAGSPAASLFDGNEFQGGYAELANIDANGHMDVYHTIGDGHSDISTISVPESNVTYTDGYTFTINGESQEIALPEEVAATAKMEAINGVESAKGLGESIYSETTGEVTNLQTSTGEAVNVEQFEHHGGYSDVYDSYFGEKDGVYNSGASLVRQMLGDEANGLSSQEADQLFLEKINSGEISEGDVVEDYLNAVGNSPEALVTTRAMMGDFMMDLDGDGTMDLIDTQDEINMAADILSSGDSEAYDNFVNDTYSTFYEKIAGGSIRFVDQSQEQYQYTTWGVLGEDNNILQRLGVVGDRPTDGVGIVFMDKNGNSIYDEETVRKLWHLPNNYDINYVADRLDCIQKTARGDFFSETVANSNPGSTPGRGDNPTPTPTPTPTPEETIEPKDYENMVRIDNNIENDIEKNVGTNDINNHTDLGTTEPTSQTSSDDYQGTGPTTVTNDSASTAAPVQDTITATNDYGQNNGGAHDNAYSPNTNNDAGQTVASTNDQSIESAPSNGDTSFGTEVEEIIQ